MKIKNKKTGEVKEVTLKEAKEMGLVNQNSAEEFPDTLMGKLAGVQKYLGESNTLPVAYGTIGSVVTGGNPIGAGAGAGLGKTMQNWARTGKPGVPMTDWSTKEAVIGNFESAKTAANAFAAQLLWNKVLGLVGNALHPLKNTGSKLEKVRSGVNLPTEDVESGILENVPKYRDYNVGTPQFKRQVDNAISRALQPTGSWQTSGEDVLARPVIPKLTNLNEVYQNLDALKSSTPPDVYDAVSNIMREYLNPQQTAQGIKLAGKYSTLKKLEPYWGIAKKSAIGSSIAAGAGGAIYALYRKILGNK